MGKQVLSFWLHCKQTQGGGGAIYKWQFHMISNFEPCLYLPFVSCFPRSVNMVLLKSGCRLWGSHPRHVIATQVWWFGFQCYGSYDYIAIHGRKNLEVINPRPGKWTKWDIRGLSKVHSLTLSLLGSSKLQGSDTQSFGLWDNRHLATLGYSN